MELPIWPNNKAIAHCVAANTGKDNLIHWRPRLASKLTVAEQVIVGAEAASTIHTLLPTSPDHIDRTISTDRQIGEPVASSIIRYRIGRCPATLSAGCPRKRCW